MQESSPWKSTKNYQWTSMTSMGAIDIKIFDAIYTSFSPVQLELVKEVKMNATGRDFLDFYFSLKDWSPKFGP